jgi:hypothetical protein
VGGDLGRAIHGLVFGGVRVGVGGFGDEVGEGVEIGKEGSAFAIKKRI